MIAGSAGFYQVPQSFHVKLVHVENAPLLQTVNFTQHFELQSHCKSTDICLSIY